MVTAKQLQGHPVLLRQGLGTTQACNAVKVIEVVSYDYLHTFNTAHGSIDLGENYNCVLVDWSTRAGLEVYVEYKVTFDEVSNVMILADKRSINGTIDPQLIFHRLGVTLHVDMGLTNFVKK